MKHLCTLLLILANLSATYAQNDTLWFTKRWAKTTKEHAEFYRPQPQKVGDLYLLKDYRIDGTLQMEAYSKYPDKEAFEGEAKWYNTDGSLYQKGTYNNNKLNGTFTSYHNGKSYVLEYKDNRPVEGERLLVYKNDYTIQYFKEGKLTKEANFRNSSGSVLRRLRIYEPSKKPNYAVIQKSTTYYDTEGKQIGKIRYTDDGQFDSGEHIQFYKDSDVISSIAVYKEGELSYQNTYYYNGNPRELSVTSPTFKKQYFDIDNNLIGELEYAGKDQNSKALNGVKIEFRTPYKEKMPHITRKIYYKNGQEEVAETFFKNGNIQQKEIFTYDKGYKETLKKIAYDSDGKLIGELTNDKNYRKNGVEYVYDGLNWYEKGKLVKQITFYDRQKDTILSRFEGNTTTYYSKDQSILGTLVIDTAGSASYIPKPLEGNRYRPSNGKFEVETFENGALVKRVSWGKNFSKPNTFHKHIELYDSGGFYRTKEIEYYTNGNVQSEIQFAPNSYNKQKGIFYDSSGAEIGQYNYNTQTGTEYEFFRNSDQIKRIVKRDNGTLLKEKVYAQTYGATGTRDHYMLVKDFDINTGCTWYNRNGTERFAVSFKDRKPYNGTFFNEKKAEAFSFKNGVKDGDYKRFAYKESDEVVLQGQYVDDKKDGVFTYYDRKQLLKTKTYKNDQLHGKATYYKNGKLFSEAQYENGEVIDGTVLNNALAKTYAKGKLVKERQFSESGDIVKMYQNGIRNTTIYHPNSNTKKYSFTTSAGSQLLDGDIIRYDSNGKAMSTAKVKVGQFVSGELWLNRNAVSLDYEYKHSYCKVIKTDTLMELKVYNEKDEIVLELKDYRPNSRYNATNNKFYLKSDALTVKDLY